MFPTTEGSSSGQFDPEGVGSMEVEECVGVPQPLQCLHETPVSPFLSKTFDLVDDPSLDSIISWGAAGASFVVSWVFIKFRTLEEEKLQFSSVNIKCKK